MSTWGDPPDQPDDRDPDATSAVPLGPEPEPTGTGPGGGAGGWRPAPQVEPFAVAALVWGIVSLALPIVGTLVALVLAARAADAIRRSQGTRTGTNYVVAARVLAGVGIALWAIGLILWLALRGGNTSHHVAVPTSPPVTSTVAPSTSTSTTRPRTTTTVRPPVTSTRPAPTISVVPPPITVSPPTTLTPTSAAPPTTPKPSSSTTPGTKPPSSSTTTTTPAQKEAKRLVTAMRQRIGPSNRGVPNSERVAVLYAPGQALRVTWAINNGTRPWPTGTPTCTTPPTTPPPTTPPPTTPPTSTTSTTTTTTTVPPSSTTSTTLPKPSQLSTSQRARYEARRLLDVVKAELSAKRLHIDGVLLVGRYPIERQGGADVDVVQLFYANSAVTTSFPYTEAFDAPPADVVECLNPAFR